MLFPEGRGRTWEGITMMLVIGRGGVVGHFGDESAHRDAGGRRGPVSDGSAARVVGHGDGDEGKVCVGGGARHGGGGSDIELRPVNGIQGVGKLVTLIIKKIRGDRGGNGGERKTQGTSGGSITREYIEIRLCRIIDHLLGDHRHDRGLDASFHVRESPRDEPDNGDEGKGHDPDGDHHLNEGESTLARCAALDRECWGCGAIHGFLK